MYIPADVHPSHLRLPRHGLIQSIRDTYDSIWSDTVIGPQLSPRRLWRSYALTVRWVTRHAAVVCLCVIIMRISGGIAPRSLTVAAAASGTGAPPAASDAQRAPSLNYPISAAFRGGRAHGRM